CSDTTFSISLSIFAFFSSLFLFFFNDPPTSEIYTLSLHDALPISLIKPLCFTLPLFLKSPLHSDHQMQATGRGASWRDRRGADLDRKSTRLNSSHLVISYAVFCLKKKKRE